MLTAAGWLLLAPHEVQAQSLTFRQQPESQNVRTGADVTLHVELDGQADSLGWTRDGIAIAGATGKSLVIEDFQPATDAGSYVCVASSAAGTSAVSNPAVLAGVDGSFGRFPIARVAGGPNPWCPLCPHPPIIDPIGRIVQGTTTTIGLTTSQAVAVKFAPAEVDAMSSTEGQENITFSLEGKIGTTRQEFGQIRMNKRDGVGIPWWLYGVFDGLFGVTGHNVVVLSGGVVVATVPGSSTEPVETAFFPDAVATIGRKFDWAPKLEGGKEGYSVQWRTVRSVKIGGITYQGDEVQFVSKKMPGAPKIGEATAVFITRDHCPPGRPCPSLSIQGIRSEGNALPGNRIAKIDAMTMKPRMSATYDPIKGSYKTSPTKPDTDPDVLPYDPQDWGGPLAVDSRLISGAMTNTVRLSLPISTSAAVPPAGSHLWTECASSDALANEATLFFVPEGDLTAQTPPAGQIVPPAVMFGAEGLFLGADGKPGVAGSICTAQQVRRAPGSTFPVRLTVEFDQADFTLDVYHQGVLKASYPCAGGPVIDLPDWLKDLVLTLRPASSATGQHFKNAHLRCAIGDPLPQPWACQVEVNGVVSQCDELIFHRENLPSPAPAAPQLFAIQRCTVGGGGGGGAGKVSLQDFHFSLHRSFGVGETIASVPNDAPGLKLTRGVPPDFDDGSTVFDPLGPLPSSLLVIPTENGVAINTKGTGADKGRVIPVALPPAANAPTDAPDFTGQTNLLLPAVQKHAINTKGAGANAGRVVAPAATSSTGGAAAAALSLSFDECAEWEAELIPVMAPGTQPAPQSTFTLTAYGVVQPPALNGLPPGEPILRASLGSLTCTAGVPTPAGQPFTVTPNFTAIGQTEHRLVVKNQGAVVLALDHRTGNACVLSRIPRRWGKLDTATECFVMNDPIIFRVSVPGVTSTPIEADEVQILLSSSPGGGMPVVKSKTDVVCTSLGWDAIEVHGTRMKRGKRSEAELNLDAAPQSPLNGLSTVLVSPVFIEDRPLPDDVYGMTALEGIVSPRDTQSGLPTGRRTHIAPHVFETRRVSFIADCPAGGEVLIDADGALGTQFGLTRDDQTGPDCGVRAIVQSRYRRTAAGAPPVTAFLTLERNPANACVISPDFSQFGGEIEVMSWSFGASNPTSIGSSGLSAGKIAVSGVSFTSPVWPSAYGSACVADGVLIGDIVWLEFPAPAEILLAGQVRTVVRLAFFARPTQPLGLAGIEQVRFTALETAKVSFSDLHFVMPPPPVRLTPTPDGGFAFDVDSPNALLLASGSLGRWDALDYEVVQNADGSICHHAILAPTAQRAFVQALGMRKGWDGTVKGSTR